MLFKNGNVGVLGHGVRKRALHLATGDVPSVDHAACAVPTFGRQIIASVFSAAKTRTSLHQVGETLRPRFNDRANNFQIAKPASGCKRILNVRFKRVVWVENGRDAALRPGRVARP